MVYRELSSFLFILILCLTGNAAALYIPSASQGGICYTTAEGDPYAFINESNMPKNISIQ